MFCTLIVVSYLFLSRIYFNLFASFLFILFCFILFLFVFSYFLYGLRPIGGPFSHHHQAQHGPGPAKPGLFYPVAHTSEAPALRMPSSPRALFFFPFTRPAPGHHRLWPFLPSRVKALLSFPLLACCFAGWSVTSPWLLPASHTATLTWKKAQTFAVFSFLFTCERKLCLGKQSSRLKFTCIDHALQTWTTPPSC